MNGFNVTAEYLDGIREGRALLRSIRARGERVMRDDMQRFADDCRDTARTFAPGPVKDTLKGEREFWLTQIKHESYDV